jgi:hypothetical protein
MDKRKKILASVLLALVLLTLSAGCGKKSSGNSVSGTSSQESNQKPDNKRPLNLGIAEDFAVLAYSNITSVPSSSINGKVGLMPGTRDMITMDPTEVTGGATEIIGSDDETTPVNLLSNAKVDMVTAYGKAVSLSPDADKIGMFQGNIGGKSLKAGVYKWDSDLNIVSDFTVEGNETDVWIFKVSGHLNVASGVHMTLGKGVKAKNIFWQVAGSAVIESSSEFYGTIMAQQFIELRNHSILTGRAFAKNGYISLNQSIINKP